MIISVFYIYLLADPLGVARASKKKPVDNEIIDISTANANFSKILFSAAV